MKRSSPLRHLAGLAPLLLLAACSADPPEYSRSEVDNNDPNNDPGNNDPGNNDPNNDPGTQAQISGQVQGAESSMGQVSLEGIAIAAFQVQGDGSLSAISEGATQTDAQGRYTVTVDLSAGVATDIIVRAGEEGQEVGSVIVTETLEAGDEATAAPITVESSVEVDVYIEARASGSWDEDESTSSGLRALISAELAEALVASGDYESGVEASARATLSAMSTWSQTLRQEAVGASEAEVSAALEAQAEAQAEHDARLDEAEGEEEREQAEEDFIEALAGAWGEAGLTVEQTTLAARASADAFILYTAELEEGAEGQARSDSEATASTFATASIEAQAALVGLGEQSQGAIAEAGVELNARIEAAGEAGQEAERDIEAAWIDYRAEVEAQLSAAFEGIERAAFEAASTAVEASIEAHAAILASLSASDDEAENAAALAEAYGALRAGVLAEGNVELLGEAFAEARAEAVLEVLLALGAGPR